MPWNEDTFTKLSYLRDITISNDGSLVAYVLQKANLKENKYENTIVIEDLSSGQKKYAEDGTLPRISPDRKKMLYLRTDEEKKQSDLYLMDIESMTSKRLIKTKNIKGIAWNRDSRKILILVSKKSDDDDLWYDSSIPVWFNGEGFRDREKFVIQIYDTEGEVVIDEFSDENVVNAFWHGDEIIYSVNRIENLFKYYDIRSYHTTKKTLLDNVPYMAIDSNDKYLLLYGRKNRKKLSEHSFLYLYDGNKIIAVNEKYGLESEDGKIDISGKVYALTADAGTIYLEIYAGGKRKRITEPGHYINALDVSRDGKIAFLMMSETELNELYIYDSKIRKVTSYNSEILKKLKPKKYKYISVNSFDKKKIDAWYLKPEGRKKSPLVVFVHGGPKGMYGYYFHYTAQLLVSHGYYALFVNPRGSTGYNEKFALEVLHKTGLGDFKDIMAAIDELLKKEQRIDHNKIGITGISYGGYMTNWAITQSPLFRVAISEQGISYWFTSYAFSDVGLWYDKEVVGDNPFENNNYRKLSPLFYVDSVKASVLLIHSMDDYRCPIDQSLMFYHLLKERNKDAHMVMFKKGAHGHSIYGKPNHRLKRYKIFVSFFEKKMNGKEFNIEEVLGNGRIQV